MKERQDFVLVFAGSHLRRFRELAQLCTRLGMLSDFLLVGEDQHAELHVGSECFNLENYASYLATRPGGTEAVTAVALACGTVADTETRAARARLVHDLRISCREMKIRFREGTISVPIGNRELSPTFVESDWAFNIVVVPQDWTGEAGQIGLPILDSFAEDIAFNAVMSVTGLWSWCSEPPLYMGLLEEHVANPPIRLVRAATRVVLLGDYANSIALAAMDPSNNWPTPPDCERYPSGPQFVERTVAALAEVDRIGMRLREAPEPHVESRERIGILDAIVLYLSALVANLLGAPRRAWEHTKERILRRVEEYVQNKTFQSESRLVVRYGGRLREEDYTSSISSRIRAIESESGVEVPAVLPNPEGWRTLVQAVLGMIDGEPPGPEIGYKAPTFRGATAVAASRAVVAPDIAVEENGNFDSGLTVNERPTQLRIRAFDSIRYREIVNELKRVREGATASAPSQDSASKSSEATAREELSAESDALAKVELNEATRVLAQMETWLSKRKDTLLWEISRFLDAQIVEVAKRLESSVQKVGRIPQRVAEADDRQRRAAKRGKWLARLLILLLLLAVTFPFLPPVASAGLLVGGALAIAFFFLPYLALLGVLTAWFASARTQVREQFRLQHDLVREYETAAKEREHYWRELHRLEYFHIQYMDWAEILAELVWRPFGAVKSGSLETVMSPDVRAISFQFAEPVFDLQKLRREQIAMRERVAGRGWLNGVFNTVRREFDDAYSQLILDDNPSARHPEMDLSLEDEGTKIREFTVYKPRTHLRQMVSERVLGARVAESKAGEIRGAMSLAKPDRLLRHVNAHDFVSLKSGNIQRGAEDFILSIFELEHVPKFERFVYRTGERSELSVGQIYWSVFGVETTPDFMNDRLALRTDGSLNVSSTLMAATRLEVSQARFEIDELRFLESSSNDRPIKQGPSSDGSDDGLEPPID